MAAMKPSNTSYFIIFAFLLLLTATKISGRPPLVGLPSISELPRVTDVATLREIPPVKEMIDLIGSCLPKCDKKCQIISQEKPEETCLRVCLSCCLVTDGCVPFTYSGFHVTCKKWDQIILDEIVRQCV